MGVFNFFTNKNADFLKDDEREAVSLLQSICNGYAHGNPDYIPNGIIKLSFGIYLMAFNRTSIDLVPLSVLNNSALLEKQPKLKLYLEVLDKIKLFLRKIVSDEKILANYKNEELFNNLMLKILKLSVSDIETINKKIK